MLREAEVADILFVCCDNTVYSDVTRVRDNNHIYVEDRTAIQQTASVSEMLNNI